MDDSGYAATNLEAPASLAEPRALRADSAMSGVGTQSLDSFLAGVEHRALVMAQVSVGNRDDALDIVQDAMLELARRYGARPSEEWAPLFHRILHNAVLQWHRKRRRQTRWLGWMESDSEILDAVPDPGPDPLRLAQQDDAMSRLKLAMRRLPLRQREVVMLRVWEGLDVAETAKAMGCGEGSVKTHLSRALGALREQLQEHL